MRQLILIILSLSLLLAIVCQGQASALGPELEIEVIGYPHLVFQGDPLPVSVEVTNTSLILVANVVVEASTGEQKKIGVLMPMDKKLVTLFLNNYQIGMNTVEIYASYLGGESSSWNIQFEVRSLAESLTLRVVDAPATIAEGMTYSAKLEVQNLRLEAVSGTRIRSDGNITHYIGLLGPSETRVFELQIDEYETGTNHLQLVAENERGSSTPLNIEFEVRPSIESLALRVIDAPASIYYGIPYIATLEIENLWEQRVYGTRITSGGTAHYYVGVLYPNETKRIELRIENYQIGSNFFILIAEHDRGSSAPINLRFEVRPEMESLTLRVIDAPALIYEGMTYSAKLQIENLWEQPVYGTRITSGNDVLYYVGVLYQNESKIIDLRIDDYEIGINREHLVVKHDRGLSSPLSLEFEVIPAESAVKAFIGSLDSPVYVTEAVDLSIIVAASEDAKISELEVKALDERVKPQGYYIGKWIASQEEFDLSEMIDISSLLTGGGAGGGEEIPERVIRGRELNFTGHDLEVGTNSLKFIVSYRLGSAVVRQELSVDIEVLAASQVKLILAKPVVDDPKTGVQVTLHVANALPVEIDAVSVIPEDDVNTSPSEFFIGKMSSGDFLPAFFQIPKENLREGQVLQYRVVYSVGRQTYETEPIRIMVDFKEQPFSLQLYWILLIILIVIGLALLVWWLRRRGYKLFPTIQLILLVIMVQLMWLIRKGPWTS